MNIHQNARLTPHTRAELVRRVLVEGQAPMAVATAMGVTGKTVGKWVARFQAEGQAGLVGIIRLIMPETSALWTPSRNRPHSTLSAWTIRVSTHRRELIRAA